MQKDKNNFLKQYFIIILIFIFISIYLIAAFLSKPLSITEIYNNTINSVVELKSYNNDEEVSYGTAVCIKDSNTFLTNAHLIEYTVGGSTSQFQFFGIRFATDNDYISVSLSSIDTEKDLALLTCSTNTNATPIKMTENYNVGDDVYALGNAQNYGISISQGIVSQKLVSVVLSEQTINAIQCDLNITDGNSGGALINSYGELIGITTFRMKDSSAKVIYGIAFSIPVTTIEAFINS
jgi:S1-C subfamily serine protease